MRRINKMLQLAISLALIPAAPAICSAQENPDLQACKALKNCKPGDFKIQMPSSSIEDLHRSVDLSAPNAENQVSGARH